MKTQLLAAALFSSCLSLHAQVLGTNVNYSTGGTNVPGYNGFFNSGDGWSNSGDPLWSGQQGWTGSGTGADSVSVVTGTTPTSPAGSASGTLGLFLPNLPLNTANVYLSRSFSLTGQYALTNTIVSFVAEWSILSFGGSENDTFVFDLRNATDTASLLTFRMNNQGVTDPLAYNFVLSSVGAGTNTQFEGTYGGLYRMQVDLSPLGGYTGSYALIDPVTRTSLASFSMTPGTLAGGFTSYDVGALRLGWELASGDPNAPGDLGIVVNEFTVTSSGNVVPEPGTWAAGAFLAFATAYVVRRRRKAEAAA